jgi:hypothetical protein
MIATLKPTPPLAEPAPGAPLLSDVTRAIQAALRQLDEVRSPVARAAIYATIVAHVRAACHEALREVAP